MIFCPSCLDVFAAVSAIPLRRLLSSTFDVTLQAFCLFPLETYKKYYKVYNNVYNYKIYCITKYNKVLYLQSISTNKTLYHQTYNHSLILNSKFSYIITGRFNKFKILLWPTRFDCQVSSPTVLISSRHYYHHNI